MDRKWIENGGSHRSGGCSWRGKAWDSVHRWIVEEYLHPFFLACMFIGALRSAGGWMEACVIVARVKKVRMKTDSESAEKLKHHDV